MRDQRGFTLVELLLAMTMSLVAAGAGLTMLGLVGQKNAEHTKYADRVSRTQISLERMTRELRQANWLQFTSSMVVDIDVPVRPDPDSPSVDRHVRYDCSAGTTCVRHEGPPTSYPVPSDATFDKAETALEWLRPGSVVFTPQRVDDTSGQVLTDYTTPTSVAVSLEITVPHWERPIRFDDAVTLRNATEFAS